MGARPNPASAARLSQSSSPLFPTAIPLFKACSCGQACDFLPSCSLCPCPIFECHSFLCSSWCSASPCVSHLVFQIAPLCRGWRDAAQGAGTAPELCQHLEAVAATGATAGRGTGKVDGEGAWEKEGPVHEIFQVGKIGRVANALKGGGSPFSSPGADREAIKEKKTPEMRSAKLTAQAS